MRNWEEKYEKLKNGDFDDRIDELKAKVGAKTATREEFQEYEKLSKARGNVEKVKNVLEYRDKNKTLLEAVKEEIKLREEMKKANEETIKLEVELAGIEQNIENITKALKDKSLTPERRTELEMEKTELESKIDNNNKKYVENQKLLQSGLNRDGKLKDYSEKDLEVLKLEVGAKISKCNLVARSLVNGLSWDSIDLKLDNMYTKKDKKFKNADKTQKLANKENKVVEEKEDLDIISSEENLRKNEELRNKKEKKEEFENKHPRLAKIGNWFRKIFKRDMMLPEGKDESKDVEPLEEESKIKKSDESFKEYIKLVAEYGYKDAKKEGLKNNKDLRARYEAMKEANRKAEEEKFGKDYADMSRTKSDEEGR